MTINRREFLKRAYQIGGLAGLYAMGGQTLINEALAKSTFISGHVAGGVVPYADWNETTELVENCLVWLMEGGATINEIGVDSRAAPLTLGNLVLTQNGSIAGQVAGWRTLDGINDYFSLTQATIDSLIANANKTWTVLFHINNWTGEDADRVFDIRGQTITELLNIVQGDAGWASSSGKLALLHYEDSVTNIGKTANNFPTGEAWIAAWSDAVNTTRFGFTAAGSGAAGQPTKWSDFAAGDRSTSSTLKGDYAGEAFNTQRNIGANAAGANYAPFKLKSVLMSDTCLIDNAS